MTDWMAWIEGVYHARELLWFIIIQIWRVCTLSNYADADLKSWIAWAETACVATCVIYYAFAARRWKGYAIFCSAHANYRQLIWHIQVKVMQKRKSFSENLVITLLTKESAAKRKKPELAECFTRIFHF